jgi:hypothetical protein
MTPEGHGSEEPATPVRSTPVQGTPRRRKRGRGYSRSGFYALKATLRTLGPRVIDRRTTLGKALATWKADLVRDLGGDVSTQQAAVVDLAVRTKLLLESIDAWLLVQPSLVNARKRALLPVVLQRQQLADALARYMTQLGLERRAKNIEARQALALLNRGDALAGPASKASKAREGVSDTPSDAREASKARDEREEREAREGSDPVMVPR